MHLVCQNPHDPQNRWFATIRQTGKGGFRERFCKLFQCPEIEFTMREAFGHDFPRAVEVGRLFPGGTHDFRSEFPVAPHLLHRGWLRRRADHGYDCQTVS